MNYSSIPSNWMMKGIAAAPGLADGPSFLWQKETLHFERVKGKDAQQERQRIDDAIAGAKNDLASLRNKMTADGHAAEAAVFDAHILMLEDSTLRLYVDELLNDTLNAEAAWMDGIQFFSEQLANIPDATS